ncbi:hypothetical protein [Brevibacillus brevis]|nr:hypothetical protein C7J99_24990 [Brevibacillus brevis]RED20921.1 hypothetical protein DES34_1273 [Brevibacillus brevis]GEC93809.1 hypothetical protein BBR01nite_61400 [Brevibacillus brevis]VEF92063.1 Uncharacterised protein [Brevibacillus brevis]
MQVGHRPDKKNTEKLDIYHKSLFSALPVALHEEKALDRAIFYGVRYLGRLGSVSVDNLESRFQLSYLIMELIALVTPRRFASIFPITKEYDGNRWGTKDYFYTVEKIAELGWDKPIGETTETVFDFLWDYHNWDVTFFLCEYMGLMSDMRRAQGQPGIMEQWAAENGIQTYTLHTTPKGEQYLMDSKGRSKPIRERRPRHLKLVVPKRRKGK